MTIRLTAGLMMLAAGGCATRAGPEGYMLATNEPFRTVALNGDVAVLRAVEMGEGARPYRVTGRRAVPGGGIDWQAGSGASRIAFSIRAGPCEDDMSAQIYPFRATIAIDGRAASGCARRLSDPVPPVPGE